MELRAFLRLLVLFLGFSYVLSSTLVTATRSLKSNYENAFSVQDLLPQDAMDLSESSEQVMFGMEQQEGDEVERRMDFESTDYPGTGANNHHDPKTPGRL
ncbi:hypothetical protein Pint_20733 [Pistacia integerrima]|uniref:Uncharacterized protein n=2 Tax=Pistacia TaxID=55512 RepID=A0ACC1A045_9ROSI|nr:hypothetical protein Pint_20733 [Pistacia integerrima]KAJ0079586.1 hypothetical protein Patl1_23530 [Pistacia atlantica]